MPFVVEGSVFHGFARPTLLAGCGSIQQLSETPGPGRGLGSDLQVVELAVKPPGKSELRRVVPVEERQPSRFFDVTTTRV